MAEPRNQVTDSDVRKFLWVPPDALKRIHLPNRIFEDDILSAGFSAIYDALSKYDSSKGPLVGWVYGIVYKRMVDEQRSFLGRYHDKDFVYINERHDGCITKAEYEQFGWRDIALNLYSSTLRRRYSFYHPARLDRPSSVRGSSPAMHDVPPRVVDLIPDKHGRTTEDEYLDFTVLDSDIQDYINKILDIYVASSNGGYYREKALRNAEVIRRRLINRESTVDIANDLGITQSRISQIIIAFQNFVKDNPDCVVGVLAAAKNSSRPTEK